MDTETARRMLLKLPHSVETLQWGERLVFWAGSKNVGGKMFAIIDLAAANRLPIAFAAGPQRAAELLEQDGFSPAPYLARAHWVAVERWDVINRKAWQEEFAQAYQYVYGRLPAKIKAALAEAASG